jgi:hypothetical protein
VLSGDNEERNLLGNTITRRNRIVFNQKPENWSSSSNCKNREETNVMMVVMD